MAHAAIILGLIAASVLALVIWIFSAEIAALIVGDNATVIALSGSLLAMAAIYQFFRFGTSRRERYFTWL